MHTAIALDTMHAVGKVSVLRPPHDDVCARARVTGRAAVPNLVHVRTIEWPERDDFLRQLDELKVRHAIRFDSALAELAGISHTAISNWRNGKARPSSTAIMRIANATDEPTRPLLAGAGLIEGQDDETDPLADVPPIVRRLITLYRTNPDPEIRERITSNVGLLVGSIEDRIALDEMKRTRQTS